MPSLVSPADAKALISTSLSDANLQLVIDRVEAQIIEKIGAPQVDGMTTTLAKTMRGEGSYLFMPTEIHEIVSIVEDMVTLDADQYQIWAGGVIERLPSGSWGDRIVVTYKPVDDRLKRKQVIIDLVRLVLERTALRQESVGGEYSYTAPSDWDAEFRKAMKRLTFQAV
ncbi:MAG: hypothetical protein EHM35_04015 [Planctomycetaceae bacterium]|nr:MAG: hypothetical protein EHM35_04015 [Planctomycetaceae bacterium]